MRAVVGVTDNDWAHFLRTDPRISEANFWVPSGRAFRGLSPGEPFLFKTKAPGNALVGGGFFDRFWSLRVSEAWAVFGTGNGVATEAQLAAKVQRYRSRTRRLYEPDPEIGCIILRNLFFAGPGGEFGPPLDWSPEIVTTKGYDLDSVEGAYVRYAYEALSSDPRLDAFYDADIRMEYNQDTGPRYGEEYLTRTRLGQGSFRLVVTAATRIAVPSRGVVTVRSCRRRTFNRTRWAASTRSLTHCSSARMRTPSSIAATSVSIDTGVCTSAHGCGSRPGMARSSIGAHNWESRSDFHQRSKISRHRTRSSGTWTQSFSALSAP